MDEFDILSGLDPETLRLMIQAGLVPMRMGAMNEQQQPQGRNVGQTYVAASPLEHLAAALRQGVSQYQIGRIGKGREAYLRSLAGGNPAGNEGIVAPQEQ